MAQNTGNNDPVQRVNTKFEKLTLEMEKIIKSTHEHIEADLLEFRVKQNAFRAIGIKYRLIIPPRLTVDIYNTLTRKLGILNELQENQFQEQPKYKSPLDFVDILVSHNHASDQAVQKLFAKQYEIKWHTLTGDPDPFSFYKFCKSVEDAGGDDVMTYDTRRAHMFSRLYQTQDALRKIRGLTHKELCPPIYARCLDENSEWATWTWNRALKTWKHEINQNIDWITNKDLMRYITGKSKTQRADDKKFPHHKWQLYWLVVEEDDPNLEQAEDHTFKTQVYVGKAANGVKQRWPGSGTSHCKKMEFTRNVMCNMLTYDPTALLSEQLVDLRVLLHKACNPDGSKSGIFIMDEFGDNDALKKAEGNDRDGIELQRGETEDTYTFRVTDMKYGMNFK